jgi:hypothetical protein
VAFVGEVIREPPAGYISSLRGRRRSRARKAQEVYRLTLRFSVSDGRGSARPLARHHSIPDGEECICIVNHMPARGRIARPRGLGRDGKAAP